MANEKKSMYFRVEKELHDQIVAIAEKTGVSMNEAARKLMIKGLGVMWQEENSDMLAHLIRESLSVVLKPHIERLAALEAKTLHMAATSTFLLVQTLQDLVPIERRKDVRAFYEKARKMAVEYARSKSEEDNINEQGNS